jgi:hypothetical protein
MAKLLQIMGLSPFAPLFPRGISHPARHAACCAGHTPKETAMNDRFRNDRSRGGQSGWQGYESGRKPDPNRQGEPLYSSAEDETRGSEWTRDRSPRYGQEGRNVPSGSYDSSGTYAQGRGYGYARPLGGDLGAGSTRGDGQIAWGGTPLSRPSGGFAGRGPKGYIRSDERIREDVCEYLSADDDVDATDIEVSVQDGEVTLEGTVQTRSMKHHAENLADEVSGVKDVHNRLRVSKSMLSEIKEKLTGEEAHHHYANGGTKGKPANGTL